MANSVQRSAAAAAVTAPVGSSSSNAPESGNGQLVRAGASAQVVALKPSRLLGLPATLLASAIGFLDPFEAAALCSRVCKAFNRLIPNHIMFAQELERMCFVPNAGDAHNKRDAFANTLRFVQGHLQGNTTLRLLINPDRTPDRTIQTLRDCRIVIRQNWDILSCFIRATTPIANNQCPRLTANQEDAAIGCPNFLQTVIARGAVARVSQLHFYLKFCTPQVLSLVLENLAEKNQQLPSDILLSAWLNGVRAENLKVLSEAAKADRAKHGTDFAAHPKAASVYDYLGITSYEFNDLMIDCALGGYGCSYDQKTLMAFSQKVKEETILKMITLNRELGFSLDGVLEAAVRRFGYLRCQFIGKLIQAGLPVTPRILATALAHEGADVYYNQKDPNRPIQYFSFLVKEMGIQPTIETLNELVRLGPVHENTGSRSIQMIETYIDLLMSGKVPGTDITFEPIKPTQETLDILKDSKFSATIGLLPFNAEHTRAKLLEKLQKAMK